MFLEVIDLSFIETVKITVATVVLLDGVVPFDPAFALPKDESISAVPEILLKDKVPPDVSVVALPDTQWTT